MIWLQYPLSLAGQLQSALDTIEEAQFMPTNTFLKSFFMLSLHKLFTLINF